MDLLDVLKLHAPPGLPLDKTTKLVRHADSKWKLGPILKAGVFDEYQAHQGKLLFKGCQHIVSFVGEGRTRSRFVGVYLIAGVGREIPSWSKNYPTPQMKPGKYFYDLKRLDAFRELEDRLIVDWGSGTRSWVQRLKPKKVIELLPEGHVRDFPGYDDFILEFDELEKIIKNPDPNRMWHTMLAGVAGVYLITDTVSGDQYVGSAHGNGGILARWSVYVKTGHGGNKKLKALLANKVGRQRSFRFSIPRTLPKSLTDKEVIEVESLYKMKLGTRAFGLNAN